MARYPAAVWRPISHNVGGKRKSTRGTILHVDGGDAASLYGWFNTPGRNASSHFYVTRAGKVEQYVDTDYIAWTSGAANSSTVGIETQGKGDGEWPEAQFNALIKLVAWLCQTYNIPAKCMATSAANQPGIGTHRLGCDGNFPALPSVQAGRKQRGGGELWSSAAGKVCPGDKRQAQWPVLVDRVAKRLARQAAATKVTTAKVTRLRAKPWGKVLARVPKGTKLATVKGSRTRSRGIDWLKTTDGRWYPARNVKGK